jgi:methyl-accepting chemotaxis protein
MSFHLKISRVIAAFGVLAAASFAAIVVTSTVSLNELQVGGPLYNKIKLGNDLVADILPPPEYVIEAYLEATLALRDPASVAAHRDRLVQLKKDYDDRRDYWSKSDLTPAIKTMLVETSDAEVQKFWNVLERDLLPALAGGNAAAAAKSYAGITTAYQAHRAVIDDIVKRTNDENAATEAEAAASVRFFSIALWCVSALVFLIVGAGVLGVGFGVIRPITAMTEVMKRLANGELGVSVPSLSRKDEVGDMAKAVEVFKENALRVKDMEAEQAALKQRGESDRRAEMSRVARDFEATIGQIVKFVSSASTDIEAAASTLSKSAEATEGLSTTVASASEKSATNVNSAAAASEEMANSVSEIGRQVEEAQRITRAAVDQAAQTNQRVATLSQAAARIGEVVKMITAVAEQTNLLALNATIEAARAGEAGRGFAVVASEVKALSAQTAKATDEIASQIGQMQAATADSVAAIEEIGGTIARISEISSAIAAAVEEQGASTQEIARNVLEAASGAKQVASSIAQVTQGAVDTGAKAQQVHGSAGALLNESQRLSLEVDRFIATIRAA